jgi:hypothetical protein
MSHYTPTPDESYTDSSNLTPLERLIQQKHGNLHDVIPRLAGEFGAAGAAARLDVGGESPSPSWVADWLRRNGYQRRTVYVKDGAA